MPTRDPLPQRRTSLTFDLPWADLKKPHTVTISFYPDGRIGEAFVSGGKSGEAVEAIARDSAIMISLALQYGVPLEVLQHAVSRDQDSNPQTIVGAVLDELVKEFTNKEKIDHDDHGERTS